MGYTEVKNLAIKAAEFRERSEMQGMGPDRELSEERSATVKQSDLHRSEKVRSTVCHHIVSTLIALTATSIVKWVLPELFL